MPKATLFDTKKKESRILSYTKDYLNRLNIFFDWEMEDAIIPRAMEKVLRLNGSIGFHLKKKIFVVGLFDGTKDENNDYIIYRAQSFATGSNVEELKNHEEVIVCGNNASYLPDIDLINFHAQMQAETDVSMYMQLINSRLAKAFKVTSDAQKKQVEKAYENIANGKPITIVSKLLDDLDTVDITDNAAIEKMQCLDSFYDTITKRLYNNLGINIDIKDKKAQVNNLELQSFDDFTSASFLVNWKARQSFCEEMEKNGFKITCKPNYIFNDELVKEMQDPEEMAEEDKENDVDSSTDLPAGEE